MATAVDKIKAGLASLETSTKTLGALEEHFNEIAATESRIAALREEELETAKRVKENHEEVIRTGAELRHAQELLAAQTEKNNQELGQQQNQLRAVEQRLKETQAQQENALAGLRALKERIG